MAREKSETLCRTTGRVPKFRPDAEAHIESDDNVEVAELVPGPRRREQSAARVPSSCYRCLCRADSSSEGAAAVVVALCQLSPRTPDMNVRILVVPLRCDLDPLSTASDTCNCWALSRAPCNW